jgi:hypothetical protein
MVASAPPRAGRTAVASAEPPVRRRKLIDFGIADKALAIAPTAAPGLDDPLAPLILQTGFASSYLPADRFSAAHSAAADLAVSGTIAARASAAMKTAGTAQQPLKVQVGSFSNSTNAERAARHFADYGRVTTTVQDRLTVVTVVTAAQTANTVIKAADDIGLRGAFVIGN